LRGERGRLSPERGGERKTQTKSAFPLGGPCAFTAKDEDWALESSACRRCSNGRGEGGDGQSELKEPPTRSRPFFLIEEEGGIGGGKGATLQGWKRSQAGREKKGRKEGGGEKGY